MTIGRELRFALRTSRSAPLVSILAVACIGLGIGAVTTVYSTASAFTFRPLPQLRDAGRLVLISETRSTDLSGVTVTPGTLGDLQALREITAVGALAGWTANVAGLDLPERVGGARVSGDFFQMTGRTAAFGRTVTRNDVLEDRRVVVLSYGLWQRRFGADSGIIGRTSRIDGEAYQIIGVMPSDFVFPAGTELWTPLVLTPSAAADRANRFLFVMARLGEGVSRQRAALAVTVLGDRIAAAHPDTHTGWILRLQDAEAFFGAGPRPFMLVMLAAVGFLLVIACANVANLLLVRATTRRREMALRAAIGASRSRLVGQLLTESMLLAIAGGALGVALAWVGIKGTAATVPVEVQQYIPGFGAIVLDYHALIVAVIVSLFAGVTFGLVPALSGSAVDMNSALKDAGLAASRRSRLRTLRSVLVVGEIALALMLVFGAALMAVTFGRVAHSDPGFQRDNMLTGTITLPEADYPSDSSVVRFWDRLRESLSRQPTVAAAEFTSVLPMTFNEQRTRVYADGNRPDHLEDAPLAGFRQVSAGYLGALNIPVLRGRAFSDADRAGMPAVAVLSETAARRLLPGDGLDRRLVIRDRVVTVIGVVRDVRANPLMSDSPTSVIYVPIAQWPSRTVSAVLRVSSGDATGQAAALQKVIAGQDARLAAGEVMSMQRVVETVTSPQAGTAKVLLASAVIALILAAVGTYGVMAYAVARRTQEIGVRVALGATTGGITRLVLAGVVRLAGTGVVLGIVGAVLLGRSMQAILVDTNPADPIILGAAAGLLGGIALLAGWLPARRASRVNPVAALRAQ